MSTATLTTQSLDSDLFHFSILRSKDSDTLLHPTKIRKIEKSTGLISEWCLILHDKDTYSSYQSKPPHYHFLVRFIKKVPIEFVSSTFSIPQKDIEIPHPSGREGFSNGLVYLTHMSKEQRELGKTIYEPHCLICNFRREDRVDWHRLKFYRENEDIESMIRRKVYTGEIALLEIEEKYPSYWKNHSGLLKKLYKKGLEERLKEKDILNNTTYPVRMNIEISGRIKRERKVLSSCLVSSLFPCIPLTSSLFYFDKKTCLTSYCNQPVILYYDTDISSYLNKNIKNKYNIFIATTPEYTPLSIVLTKNNITLLFYKKEIYTLDISLTELESSLTPSTFLNVMSKLLSPFSDFIDKTYSNSCKS